MTQCFHEIFTEIEIKSNEIESVVLEFKSKKISKKTRHWLLFQRSENDSFHERFFHRNSSQMKLKVVFLKKIRKSIIRCTWDIHVLNRKVVKLKVAAKRRGRLGRKYGLLWKKSSVDSFSIPILVQKIMTQFSASAGEAEQNHFGQMRHVHIS